MIYFDNAATTKTDAIALDALKKFGIESFYNPSALYKEAAVNFKALTEARTGILRLLRGDGDFIFTASGTEADNMAIYGAKKPKNSRIIVSEGEHAAMLAPANDLKQKGYDVVFAPINGDGSLNIVEFKKLLTRGVSFVSILHVSNETGAVNDIEKIVKLVRAVSPDAIIHSDGVQALGKININLLKSGVDLYSVSAHKVHAPRGVGGLYIKKGVKINPLILGGGQEKGLRSATENLAGNYAFFKILEKNLAVFDAAAAKRKEVLDRIRRGIISEISDSQIISPENSPHILTVALKGVRGEVVLHSLEEYGILIGVGSACGSKKGINKTQAAFGLDDAHKEGIIRISVSEENTLEEADELVAKLKTVTQKLSGYKRI